jgi:transposase-like protein
MSNIRCIRRIWAKNVADALAGIKTLQEAVVYFSDQDQALEYIVQKRWPDGVKCPHCGCDRVGFLSTRRKWKCKNPECRKQFSVKVGTIMEDSPLGLDKWLVAIWLIVNAKNGISSCELGRAIGVTQKSAWFLNHRIRLAMQTGTFEKLSGEVEADETYIGGKARNMHADKKREKIKGTGTSGKTIVLGAMQRGPKGETKVKAKVIKSTDRETLKREVEEAVEKGATLYTDAHSGYDLLNADYVRLVIDHAVKYVDGRITTNGIENFWTLLKRCLKGTYIAVEPFHLFRYLDEQNFRYNERQGSDQERFLKALEQLDERRMTYKQLTGKV